MALKSGTWISSWLDVILVKGNRKKLKQGHLREPISTLPGIVYDI